MMRNIDGKSTSHSSTPIEAAGGRLLKTDEAKADGRCKEYAGVSKLDISKEDKRDHSIKSSCQCGGGGSCCPFTMAELQAALNRAKLGKAEGADGISNEMLRHLGHSGKQIHLDILNRSWLEKAVPTDWRRATVIPILKPGKPPTKPGSYRPISLTSCVATGEADGTLNTRTSSLSA